ncbi:MAG: ribonuclease [Thermomicrobiales bacterium]|jgi:ribonuclease Z|nr:ribonuclease [Thermomicrobiales bacterium]
MIDLLLLGNGAMLPLPNRWLSSLLVRCDGELTLFDCGEGTQIPWRRFGWGFRRLSAICLSHWHADHVAGLPGLLHSLANADRTEPVTIYGPEQTKRVVAGLREIAPHLPFAVDVQELADGDRFDLPGGLRTSALAGEHRVPCLVYRVDLARARRFDPDRARTLAIPIEFWRPLQRGESVTWSGGSATPNDVLGPDRPGISFGFATDTRPLPTMPPFFEGVDLLITEGTYGDSADLPKAIQNKHMTFAEAATLAREAHARALWLTHFSPAMDDPAAYLDEATAIFPETTIGDSGLTGTLKFQDDNGGDHS